MSADRKLTGLMLVVIAAAALTAVYFSGGEPYRAPLRPVTQEPTNISAVFGASSPAQDEQAVAHAQAENQRKLAAREAYKVADDAQLADLVRSCQDMIRAEMPGSTFPAYSAQTLDSTIGFIGMDGSARSLSYLLLNAPKYDPIADSVRFLKQLREIDPTVAFVELAVERPLGSMRLYEAYSCSAEGLSAASIRQKFSFSY